MEDYKDRKLTGPEIAGVSAAVLMFFGVGMIMGGSASGNMKLFWSGVGVFSIGSAIALYLLFKYKPKKNDENF